MVGVTSWNTSSDGSMNAFPRQQRADSSLRPGGRTLRGRHSVLVQVAGNRVGGLALDALPHNAGHHIVWHRSWSAEPDAVLLLDLQRLAGTHPNEVALQLREDHSHMRHGLAHRCAGVDAHLGDDQPPALLLRQTQQAGEVLSAAAGAVDLGEDQRL